MRWLGPRRVEKYLRRSCGLVKLDPDAVVTDVNCPSTECLDLRLLDIVSINICLEQRGFRGLSSA